MDEITYEDGKRGALVSMLRHILRALGQEDAISQSTKWIVEREEIIGSLRIICADYGDNDWDETLHLADVIEKHLYRHLEQKIN